MIYFQGSHDFKKNELNKNEYFCIAWFQKSRDKLKVKPFSGSISRQIPPWPVFAWAVSISPLLQSRVLPVKPITGTTDHLRKPARECKYIFSLCYCITWSPPIAKSFKWKTCYPNLRPLLNSQSDFSIMILGFWFGIWANGFFLPPILFRSRDYH